MKQTETIGGRECTVYTTEGAQLLLLQPVDAHDQSLLDSEVETIGGLTDVPFTLVAFAIKEWMNELTPWPAPPTFGRQPFGDGAEATLGYVSDVLLPSAATRWPASSPCGRDTTADSSTASPQHRRRCGIRDGRIISKGKRCTAKPCT